MYDEAENLYKSAKAYDKLGQFYQVINTSTSLYIYIYIFIFIFLLFLK